MTSVRRMVPADADACDAIIAALPYFFPDASGVENAARDVRKNAGWVTQDDGRVTGFLSLEWSTSEAAEVAWMAVHAGFRRAGRGRLLMERAMEYARANGAKMLMVFVSDEDDPAGVIDGFEGTKRFYRGQGFVPLWSVKPEGWSMPHLLMVRSLERGPDAINPPAQGE